MNKQITLWAIALLIVVVVAGTYLYLRTQSNQNNVKQAQTTQTTNGKPVVQHISWKFNQLPAKEDGTMPQVQVVATINGKEFSLGTEAGSCSIIDEQNIKLLPNEIAGVQCWFAGGGSEYGVFQENGTTEIKKGEIDEGSAESAGFRGNFVTVQKL